MTGEDQDNVMLMPYTTVQKRLQATSFSKMEAILVSARAPELIESAKIEIRQLLMDHHHIAFGLMQPLLNAGTILADQKFLSSMSAIHLPQKTLDRPFIACERQSRCLTGHSNIFDSNVEQQRPYSVAKRVNPGCKR